MATAKQEYLFVSKSVFGSKALGRSACKTPNSIKWGLKSGLETIFPKANAACLVQMGSRLCNKPTKASVP